jgi:uncharacterized protein (DUF1501 family)
MTMRISRRAFLQLSAAGASSALLNMLVPRFAFAEGPLNGRTLVICRLDGGHDNCSMFPYMDSLSAALAPRRSSIHVAPSAALDLNGRLGLHPNFGEEFRQLHSQDGNLKLINSVGIPDTSNNGSHNDVSNLLSIGALNAPANERTGFLGRLMKAYDLNSFEVLGVQSGPALDLYGADKNNPLVLDSLDSYERHVREGVLDDRADQALSQQIAQRLIQLPIPVSTEEKAVRETLDAMYSSLARVQSLAGVTVGAYPGSGLGRAFRDIARVVRGKALENDRTNTIVFVHCGGFDTHGDQVSRLGSLVTEVADATVAFANDMKGFGMWNSTGLLFLSEFGRTLAAGGEGGTDHGWSTTYCAAGGAVNGASNMMVGPLPTAQVLQTSFAIPVQVDFRNVYAECLTWLGFDPARIFTEAYPKTPLNIFRA